MLTSAMESSGRSSTRRLRANGDARVVASDADERGELIGKVSDGGGGRNRANRRRPAFGKMELIPAIPAFPACMVCRRGGGRRCGARGHHG